MTAARRVVLGIENDDGSTVIWRLDAANGPLMVYEDWKYPVAHDGEMLRLQGPPQFNIRINGRGFRTVTDGPVDIEQLPRPTEELNP